MRRSVTAAIALILTAVAAPASAGSLAVPLDGAVRLQLRGAAADVIVSNPAIADVAIVDDRTVVVLGRGHGTTGVMVFDAARRLIWEGPVTVTAPAGRITIYRGAEEQQYACVNRCERAAVSGPAAAAAAAAPVTK